MVLHYGNDWFIIFGSEVRLKVVAKAAVVKAVNWHFSSCWQDIKKNKVMKNRTRKKKTRNQNHRMKSMPTNSKKDIDNEWINQDVSAERQPGFGAIGGAPQSDLGVGAARGDQAFVSVVVETHDALAKKMRIENRFSSRHPCHEAARKRKWERKRKSSVPLKPDPTRFKRVARDRPRWFTSSSCCRNSIFRIFFIRQCVCVRMPSVPAKKKPNEKKTRQKQSESRWPLDALIRSKIQWVL